MTSKESKAMEEKDRKLLEAFHELDGSEGIETKEDLLAFIKHVGTGLSGIKPGASVHIPETTSSKFPRISLFYGEKGKGEVGYATWKYEIRCLLKEKSYTPEQILLGIRRSVKGQASDILRHLGISPSIDEILTKFEATYGDINTPVSILRNLYTCEQNKDEPFITYASRVEEIAAEAVELKAMTPVQVKTELNVVLYSGMRQPLKQLCNYMYNTIDNYEDFKVECRKVEAEMLKDNDKKNKKDDKPQSQAMTKQQLDSAESNQFSDMKNLLQEMNERIKKLEMEKEQSQFAQQHIQRGGYPSRRFLDRGQRHYRGTLARGQPFRSRGTYQPRRPTGTTTFRPTGTTTYRPTYNNNIDGVTCYRCNKQGHIARYCSENM
jgi:hypothetical protein